MMNDTTNYTVNSNDCLAYNTDQVEAWIKAHKASKEARRYWKQSCRGKMDKDILKVGSTMWLALDDYYTSWNIEAVEDDKITVSFPDDADWTGIELTMKDIMTIASHTMITIEGAFHDIYHYPM